jgi:S1-C subfamily serine protease
MNQSLAALSHSISHLVAVAAPLLSAIRIGPNRHLTGLVCAGGLIVTVDQELPALEAYTVVLSGGHLAAARSGPRDPGRNLAMLHLETAWPVANPEIAAISVGSLAVLVGADADASPTVRLTMVHRLLRTADGPAPLLDLSGTRLDPGSLVLDPEGRLIGLAAFGRNGEALAISGEVVGQMMMPSLSLPSSLVAPPQAAPIRPHSSSQRGWLGVALQPITVPDALVARAGQASGRMVVSITKGGPAEMAGLRVGDVLLALNGTSASGPHALRAFLGSERIGSTVEVKSLRDGTVMTTRLTIAVQPG